MTTKEQAEQLLQRLIIEKNAQNATWAGKLTIVEAFRRDVERATWEAAVERVTASLDVAESTHGLMEKLGGEMHCCVLALRNIRSWLTKKLLVAKAKEGG